MSDEDGHTQQVGKCVFSAPAAVTTPTTPLQLAEAALGAEAVFGPSHPVSHCAHCVEAVGD